jgi:hypothetical protein
MSAKNCTTHHLACNCIEARREEEIKGLIELLRRAIEYVECYCLSSDSKGGIPDGKQLHFEIKSAIESHDKGGA